MVIGKSSEWTLEGLSDNYFRRRKYQPSMVTMDEGKKYGWEVNSVKDNGERG